VDTQITKLSRVDKPTISAGAFQGDEILILPGTTTAAFSTTKNTMIIASTSGAIALSTVTIPAAISGSTDSILDYTNILKTSGTTTGNPTATPPK